MASSKADYVDTGTIPASALLATSTPNSSAAFRPDAQARKSNRSRTSNFLSNTLLRPRGKSVSHTLADDWGRPVGGSEGLGCIYTSSMNPRERSQVLRSVTHLTKDSADDVFGAAAEAFSGNATPSVAPRNRFFTGFRAESFTNVRDATAFKAPPIYQTDAAWPEPRRGSEGSVVSHICHPRQERGSFTQSSSTSSRQPSYFSSGASSSASGSATSSGSASVATSPDPRPALGQRRKSHQRSSSQFSATARQAFCSSRSFLGPHENNISEDADAAHASKIGYSTAAESKDEATGKGKQMTDSIDVAESLPNPSYFNRADHGLYEAITSASARSDDDDRDADPVRGGGNSGSRSEVAQTKETASIESSDGSRPIGKTNPACLSDRRTISILGDPPAVEASLNKIRPELPFQISKASKSQVLLGQHYLEMQLGQSPIQSVSNQAGAANSAPACAASASAAASPFSVSRADASVPTSCTASAAAEKCDDDALSLALSTPSPPTHLLPSSSSASAVEAEELAAQRPPSSSSQILSQPESISHSQSQSLSESQSQSEPSSLGVSSSHVESSTLVRSAVLSVVPSYPTAPSTPWSTSASNSVVAFDTFSPSLSTTLSVSRTPSHPSVGLDPSPSPNIINNIAATTAAKTPPQSTSKLASVQSSASTTSQLDTPTPSAFVPVTGTSQHVSALSAVLIENHENNPAKRSESKPTASACASASNSDRCVPPTTPPNSSGPCLSSRSSNSGVPGTRSAIEATSRSIPFLLTSKLHGKVSSPDSRRRISTDSALPPVSALFPRTSVASTSPGSRTVERTRSSTGRVSFDLRQISIFGGSPGKMSSNNARSSFASIGNDQSFYAADTHGTRQASSPPGTTSKFFSRISLPGSNRKSSVANDPSPSTPDSKSRSRFVSFGRLGRGNGDKTSPNGSPGLRDSMQTWASASTDVLPRGSPQGRNSLAIAREEATLPRKSLHLPRTNLINLDADEGSDTIASIGTTTNVFDNQALPPTAIAPIKPDNKPVSPTLSSARRPSLNFLRRGSATSTSSNADNANGERRGSLARSFMNRTLSRQGKNDVQQEAIRSVQTTRDEAESVPTFRNGIFDSQAPVSIGSVAYPGMSPTVNWNAAPKSASSNSVEISPGEIDPIANIPAYPGPAAANDALATQPKTVAISATSALAERRPSQGIDQEQDAAEASDTVQETLAFSSNPSTAYAAANQSTDPTASRQRNAQSSHALSHLPRLNSMRTIAGTSGDASGVNSERTRSESTTDGTIAGETSEEEQEASEDEDESDLTGQTSDYHDVDTETEDETDDDNTNVARRRVSAAPMAATGSSGGLNRNRPTESLILPPAPFFIPNSSSLQNANTSASAASAAGPSDSVFSQTVGRDSWTSFNTTGFTPFETPTPSFGGGSFNTAFAGPTPRARQELSESSYFTARPSTNNNGRATTAATMSGDAPPPSPSIISRSRAPSSASVRTLRTPGASTVSSGPVPHRSMPAPVGAFPPLALSRQISTASGSTARSGPDHSKSPGLGLYTSRPSTSGTLNPHQPPAGERAQSREPSIDQSAIGRPVSRHEEATRTTPKTASRQLVGLDSVSTSGSRPNFYQQKSKSLVDLLGSASRRLEIDTSPSARPIINEPPTINAVRASTTPRPPSEVPAYSKRDGLAPINTSLTAPPASIASPGGLSIGRRRSMFEIRQEPPPYSIVHNRPEGPQIILPREEEGKEKLPTYCCGVHIEGYLPRKMEFSAPGVQAKDRSWRRQYLILHGTSLRVYKNDLSVDRHAANGIWGEMKGVHVHLEPMNEDGSNGSGSGIGLGAAAREAISHTPLGHHRSETNKATKDGSTQFDAKNGLARNYTLQGAESGLAADYLKRRHVVRVRAEGEQFLLQTRSDRHVVDWIEALQAATNVSMDLEKRPMPKFITLPRRRRRRRRNPDGTTLNPEEQEARDLAEAQRRSMAEASGRSGGGSGAGNAEATPRTSMSQATGGRPSMSMENEMDPSAAFERMLREDQEEGGRQSAAVM
ncbi:uncharacterized protein MEPE_03692 [Melanopsichium pennsylvanicum]|uniref:PH domain-containing protein n=2 Tax=Melanopsichium pennsylvanicum TaxID=63383 RepID=A0AAJ4XPY0_9BASI|nr:ph domain containing protein [Melanopsichium pennsylvanicum 4]SNX84983.1 uncharacterized protein MEPE_03692 [Melanopsichium pennsylvanicum]